MLALQYGGFNMNGFSKVIYLNVWFPDLFARIRKYDLVGGRF